MIAHDRRIAENTASDRLWLQGNIFQWSGDRQQSSAIIWEYFSAIGRSSAIVSDPTFSDSSDPAIESDHMETRLKDNRQYVLFFTRTFFYKNMRLWNAQNSRTS